jgi:hypothetical protein
MLRALKYSFTPPFAIVVFIGCGVFKFGTTKVKIDLIQKKL